MFILSPARWLAALPALAALAAGAQPSTDTATHAQADATPALSFHSAMEGYRPFKDPVAISWREANDTVRRRGGWQAYAREASEGDVGESPGEHPHDGHGKPASSSPHAMEAP